MNETDKNTTAPITYITYPTRGYLAYMQWYTHKVLQVIHTQDRPLFPE